MCAKSLVLSVLIGVGFLMPRQASAYTDFKTVGNGETYVLAAADNTLTNQITLAAGATLQLTSATLNAYLRVTGGEATLEGPAGTETITLVGGLREMSGGSLKVVNAKSLAAGRDMRDVAHWPMIDAETISFADPDATGLVLTNRVFVRKVPDPSVTPLVVASGATLAFRESGMLERVSGQDDLTTFTLSGWNLMQMGDEVFPTNTTITVRGGSAYILKSCEITENNEWSGSRATTTPNSTTAVQVPPFANVTNVVLASDANGRASVKTYSVREQDLLFAISGVGDFEQIGSYEGFPQERINISGDLTFDGTISATGASAGLVFQTGSLTNWMHAIDLNGNNNRLQYWGGPTQVYGTPLYLHELHGNSTSPTLFPFSGQIWEIGTLYGAVKLAGQGASTCTIQIDRMDATAKAYLTDACTLKLIAADEGAEITIGNYYDDMHETILDLRAFTGTSVPLIHLRSTVALKVLGGTGLTLRTEGEGMITVPDGTRIESVAARISLDIPAGTNVTVAPAAINWQAKVTQWYDASEASTLGGYPKNANGTDVVYSNNYPIICRWGDKRTGTNGVHLFNGRSFGGGVDVFSNRHDEVNPFVVKGGLNGLDYVSCGSCQGKIAAKWQNSGTSENVTLTEARRLHMAKEGTHGNFSGPNTSLSCAYAILVFGSAQGGGAAILAGGDFVRDRTLNNPFFKSGDWPMYVDGVATNGNSCCPNGGWQILSIPLGGKTVNGIGWNSNYQNSGGQDYAEILLFETTPTEAERRACEVYLAEKWGLLGSYAGGVKAAPRVTVNGHGAVTVASDAELAGGFRGTVTVPAGVTLTVQGDAPSPPTEAVVPSENRIIWFDPDLEGGVRE